MYIYWHALRIICQLNIVIECKSSLLDKLMTVYTIITENICTFRERASLKSNAYDEIYSGNSLNVCIYLTTA